MKCPKCQFDNPEAMKFCGECGAKLDTICSECNFFNPPQFKFCGECGNDLSKSTEAASREPNKYETRRSEPTADETIPTFSPAEGERKHITVLFSDLSGYTTMSELMIFCEKWVD